MTDRTMTSLSRPTIGWFELPLCLIAVLFGLLTPVSAFAGPLPDNRAYEMVSPVEKEGADVETGIATASMSAIDGNRFFFTSRGSFAGQPTTLAAEASPYLAVRGSDGWTTKGAALPNGALSIGYDGYMGFDPSMAKGVLGWKEDTRFGGYDPSARPGYNIYMRDSETGSFELLNGTLSSMTNEFGFKWGSSDFGKLALEAPFPLTSGTPCGPPSGGCAWEWDHGVLRLASVLPDGTAVNGAVGDAAEGAYYCNFEHAMSDDGSRLFFTVQGNPAEQQLYARENGASSILLSGSERTVPGGASGSETHYQSAEAAHGNRVLFTTRNSLVDADTNEATDLYMYDFAKPAGERLTLISQDENSEAPEGAAIDQGEKSCGGLVGAAEDLKRVYFVADNQIVSGAPTGSGPKLYLWDDSGASPLVTYIATLTTGKSDSKVWATPSVSVANEQGIPRQSRWSRDGRYLAFISTASLTGFENEGEEEIYRYDAVSGSLVCVTCVAGAVPAHGEVTFQPVGAIIKPVNHLPQNVSDSGQVFFQTTRGLVSRDSNGERDVYEYDGALHLISKGTSASPSTFLDATPAGSDVFFGTSDRLVGWDSDGNVDVYDARIGGGFPEPSFVSPSCEGEACLASVVAPDDATPTSFTFSGAGNPVRASATAACGAGLVRVKGVCHKKALGTKKTSRKKRGKKRRRQHRHTTRSHG